MNTTPPGDLLPCSTDEAALRSPLTLADEAALVARIEGGVTARAALEGELRAPDGTGAADLWALVADGEAAREQLARANTGLVWYVVGPVSERTGEPWPELFQEGMVGLLEAIQRFDPRRGKFATCALPRIRMRVWDAAITRHGALGLPARRARQWRKACAVATELTAVTARVPEPEEIARETGETTRVIRSLMTFRPTVSLDRDDPRWLCVPEEGGAVASAWGPGDGSGPLTILRLLRRLEPQDRRIVQHLYGLGGPARSHREVAQEAGLSESTVRRRERAALSLMRAGVTDDMAA